MKKVLYVEDDKINRFIVGKFLKADFELDMAEDGSTAIELVSKNKYDLILMDINLGKDSPDGVEMMKVIRKIGNYSNTPFFAVTAFALTGDKERFMEAGFDLYLPKPLEREELIQNIYTFTN